MFSCGLSRVRGPCNMCRIKRRLQLTCSKHAATKQQAQGPQTLKRALQAALSSVWQAAPDSNSSSGSSKGSTGASKPMQGSRRSPEQGKYSRTGKQRGRPGQQHAGEAGSSTEQSKPAASDRGRFYWNITGFPFPLGPLLKRRTVRYEVSSAAL